MKLVRIDAHTYIDADQVTRLREISSKKKTPLVEIELVNGGRHRVKRTLVEIKELLER